MNCPQAEHLLAQDSRKNVASHPGHWLLTVACIVDRPTINMEIPTAKYGKTTKNMEKMHVIMRVKMQWV